jgi:hypothetical protein
MRETAALPPSLLSPSLAPSLPLSLPRCLHACMRAYKSCLDLPGASHAHKPCTRAARPAAAGSANSWRPCQPWPSHAAPRPSPRLLARRGIPRPRGSLRRPCRHRTAETGLQHLEFVKQVLLHTNSKLGFCTQACQTGRMGLRRRRRAVVGGLQDGAGADITASPSRRGPGPPRQMLRPRGA